jgi:hypothetical protein
LARLTNGRRQLAKIGPVKWAQIARQRLLNRELDLGTNQSGTGGEEDGRIGLGRLDHRLTAFFGPHRGQVFQEALTEYRAATNRSAVGIAGLARLLHAAIHMFGWLKSHFFCFLLLIGG